jgi:N-glycosylase/DNA lyase
MPTTSPPKALTASLRCAEEAGFEAARVLDQRPGSEPIAEQVELCVGGETLRFYWGEPHELGTAAYWAEQTRRRPEPATYRLGASLAEEVAACLLGGHGVPAAVGLAAYVAVRDAGLLLGTPTMDEIDAVLSAPLQIPGRERLVRYRFARQRAERLSAALATLAVTDAPANSLELREWLTTLPGIGLKTASWVVRNHHGCDEVAIVDIHVQRAGAAAGFFASSWRLPRDYGRCEEAFCKVAELACVRASALDACMWDQMQCLGRAQGLLLGGA